MPSSKLKKGNNDLAILFPDLATEADGWDPSEFLSQSNKKQKWKCSLGHRWEASIDSRKRTGCPYCSGNKPLKGFNTFLDHYPEIAKEADGWDPSTCLAGSHSKKNRFVVKDIGGQPLLRTELLEEMVFLLVPNMDLISINLLCSTCLKEKVNSSWV